MSIFVIAIVIVVVVVVILVVVAVVVISVVIVVKDVFSLWFDVSDPPESEFRVEKKERKKNLKSQK